MKVLLSIVREAIDSEPELPGGIPDEMWEAIQGDRDAFEQAMRISVKLTKEGIKSRLADFINKGI